MLAVFLLGMFALHVKDQFANSRARLTPDFQRVHVTVAAAVALLLVVFLPAVLIWLIDLRSIGLVALMVFLLGTHLCSLAMRSFMLSWLIILGFLAMFTAPAKMLLWQLISGQCEPLAVILLAIGAAMTVLGGIRLIALNEDMPAYHSPMRAGWAGKNQMSGQSKTAEGILPRAWQERLAEKSIARWTTHARHASTSSWSSVGRWQVGLPSFWAALVMGIVANFFFFIVFWMTGQNQRAGTGIPLMMISVLLPSMFLLSMGNRRIAMLGRELLLPVDRPSYMRQLGMAAAVGHLEVWAGMSVGLTLWFLLTATWQSFSFTDLALVLGIYALLQPWFFGVGVWFLRYRSLGMQIGSLVGAVYVSMVPAALYAAPGPLDIWRYSALPVAGMIAVFGLLITFDAYRRWLVTDLD
jgi:hypothetical protein